MSRANRRLIPAAGIVLAWISILFGAATAATPALPRLVEAAAFSTAQLGYFVLLGLTSLVAGIDALRGSPRAFYVLWYVYAVQMFAYASDSLTFNFMAPYSITFGMGDYEPRSIVSINVPAIAACLVALYCARFLRRAISNPEVSPGV
jgi:hypothetical protein